MFGSSVIDNTFQTMLEAIHQVLLMIHIPVGTLSLILFWIPVGVKKGSRLHRKVGRYYYYCMWIVLITAFLMCITNLILGNYISAAFLGYLAVITSYPLWYSYEILNQDKIWTDIYFQVRRFFSVLIFVSSIAMFLLGAIKFNFRNMGGVMAFFGLLGIPAIRDVLMTKEKATNIESKLKMHIQGTIISGIAAYTAFFAFGGSRFLMGVLQLDTQWMILPWTLPTLMGLVYMRYMKKKYKVAG